mgnify:CR=1 FL=1
MVADDHVAAGAVVAASRQNTSLQHSRGGSPFVGHHLAGMPPAPGSEDRMSPFMAIILLYGVMLLMVGAQVRAAPRVRWLRAMR